MLVLNRQRAHRVRRHVLVDFVRRMIAAYPAKAADSLAVTLVSDRRMREYNRRFRGKDHPTDVLSFPSGDDPVPDGERHLGDIVISVPTAVVQARRARHCLVRELERLTLHGYLHLLGHDHETDDGEMARLQRRLARRLIGPARARRP